MDYSFRGAWRGSPTFSSDAALSTDLLSVSLYVPLANCKEATCSIPHSDPPLVPPPAAPPLPVAINITIDWQYYIIESKTRLNSLQASASSLWSAARQWGSVPCDFGSPLKHPATYHLLPLPLLARKKPKEYHVMSLNIYIKCRWCTPGDKQRVATNNCARKFSVAQYSTQVR